MTVVKEHTCTQKPATLSSASTVGKTVLIVEPDTSLGFLLEKAMQKACYRTICASRIDETLTILYHQPVDLILIDIVTNRWEDFNTCRDIRQHFSIPIVILSAHSPSAVQKHAEQLAAAAYLRKPIRLSQLHQCVASLLGD